MPVWLSTIGCLWVSFLDANRGGLRKFKLQVRIVLRKQQDAPAWPRESQGLRQRSRKRDRDQHNVSATTLGASPNLRFEAWRRVKGHGMPRRLPRDVYIAWSKQGASQDGQTRAQQAYRTLAKDHNRLASRHMRLFDGFEASVHWLHERGFLEAHSHGYLDHASLGNPGHRSNVFGETAAIGIEARGQLRLSLYAAHWENRRRSDRCQAPPTAT